MSGAGFEPATPATKQPHGHWDQQNDINYQCITLIKNPFRTIPMFGHFQWLRLLDKQSCTVFCSWLWHSYSEDLLAETIDPYWQEINTTETDWNRNFNVMEFKHMWLKDIMWY
jgi:hypothetical protein